MLKVRVIPILLWDARGLCKPIAFQRPGRFVGSLMSAAMLYENRTCDELILLDIDATEYRRAPRFEEVKQFTSKLMCPTTFGGGIRCVEDIRQALMSGADKIVIRSHATPSFIADASKRFGSQCIVVAIDYFQHSLGYRQDIMQLAKSIEDNGAGEIILTRMDRDGTRSGYDLVTIHEVCSSVKIPVIANGGCSGPPDMLDAIKVGAHAVAASSIFLYSDVTPSQCKEYLAEHGVPVRIEVFLPTFDRRAGPDDRHSVCQIRVGPR
jgi:imidazole glycerol-phosphate synthase subunit HisF